MATTTTTSSFNIRIDTDVKNQCEELFHNLGLNMTTAINIFLRQALIHDGLPFNVKMNNYNQTTIDAMNEAVRLANDPNTKTYDDINEILAELKK